MNDEYFRSLIEHVMDVILVLNSDTLTIEYASPSFERVHGRKPEEITGTSALAFFHPEDVAIGKQSVGQAVTNPGVPTIFRVRIEHKDGSWQHMELITKAVSDPEGRSVIVVNGRDITEHVKLEETLKQKEEHFRNLIENVVGVIMTLDGKGRVTYAGPSFQRFMGYSPEEMIGRDNEELLHPDDRDLAKENYLKAVANPGQTIGPMVLRKKHKNGAWLFGEVFIKANIDETGKITCYVNSMDITESKLQREALETSRMRLSEAMDLARIVYWEFDPLSKTFILDDTFYDFLGTAAAEEGGYEMGVEQFVERFIHPEERQAFYEEMDRSIAKLDSMDMQQEEYRHICRNGEVLSVLTLRRVVRDDAGRVVRVHGITQDITKRKEMEESLKKSEELYRLLADNVRDIVFFIDLDTLQPTYMSPSCSRLMGYTPHELIIGTPAEALSPADFVRVTGYLRKSIESARAGGRPEPARFELLQHKKDGTVVWLESDYSMVYDDKGKLIAAMGVQRDVTERKKTEQELAARTEELVRSNRELEQFAYVASHDLQEPLRMVASYVELLAKRYKGRLDEDADEFITFAVDGADRMKRLINDLLAYSRVGTKGKSFISTDTNVVLAQAMQNLKVAMEDSGAKVICETLPPIMADDMQLSQIFQNLISNAIKFRGEEPPCVHISAKQVGEEWVFSVKDNGIGIEEKYFDRIFMIFQRLHSRQEYSGTGIGLAVCKRIVERHGGRMWVESEPGRGSVFYFTIPIRGVGVL